ncbi:MAG: PPOX class F420-dependent oxidoreductase [Candidatus Dormibacteraceae bacterium]
MTQTALPTASANPLTLSKYWLLTTYRRDGTPVGTPVNVALRGGTAYFRTWETSGKAKRMRRRPQVQLQPCGPRGRVNGEVRLHAVATLLEPEEASKAASALARQHPFLHGLLVPRLHKLRGWSTQHYRLDLCAGSAPADEREPR